MSGPGNGPYSYIFLTTVAIQFMSLYSPGNGLYSDTFFRDFLCKNKTLCFITLEDSRIG